VTGTRVDKPAGIYRDDKDLTTAVRRMIAQGKSQVKIAKHAQVPISKVRLIARGQTSYRRPVDTPAQSRRINALWPLPHN
jgi:hypothetical protein